MIVTFLQDTQMDKSPLYVYQGFDGGGRNNGGIGLRGIGQMRRRRRGGWRRGQKRQGTLSSSYRPRLAVGG